MTTNGRLLEIPCIEVTEDLLVQFKHDYHDIAKYAIRSSVTPGATAAKLKFPCMKQQFFSRMRTDGLTKERDHKNDETRSYEYKYNGVKEWIYQTSASAKKASQKPDAFFLEQKKILQSSMKSISLEDDLAQLEKLCLNRTLHYRESRVLEKPIFSPLFALKEKNPTKKLDDAIFPEDFGFNTGMASPAWEAISMTYGNGSGLWDPWCYLKSVFTGTLFHFEAFNLGSINAFGGDGYILWYCTPADSYEKIHSIYEDAELSDHLHDAKYKADRYDCFMKRSGPSVSGLLKQGIDIYFARQEDGEVIITLPRCLHSVFNFGYGIACARNYICSESMLDLRDQLYMANSSNYYRTDRNMQLHYMQKLYESAVTGKHTVATQNWRWVCDSMQINQISIKDNYQSLFPYFINPADVFEATYAIKAMRQIHHSPTYFPCSSCSFIAATKKQFSEHRRCKESDLFPKGGSAVQSSSKAYSCDICTSASFRNKTGLTQHRQPKPCKRCGSIRGCRTAANCCHKM